MGSLQYAFGLAFKYTVLRSIKRSDAKGTAALAEDNSLYSPILMQVLLGA
jgi:hypothetical protein